MRILKASLPPEMYSFLHAGYCSASPGYRGMEREEVLEDSEVWEAIRRVSQELSDAEAQRNRERTRRLREKHNKPKVTQEQP